MFEMSFLFVVFIYQQMTQLDNLCSELNVQNTACDYLFRFQRGGSMCVNVHVFGCVYERETKM